MRFKFFICLSLLILLSWAPFAAANELAVRWVHDAYEATLAKDWDKCIEAATKAIEYDKDYSYAYFRRGYCCYQKKDYDQALQDLNKALSSDLKTNMPYALNVRGRCWYKKGQYAKAIEDFNQALSYKSDWFMAYANRGRTKYHLGDPESGIQDLTHAIKLNPEIAWIYSSRAWYLLHLGRLDEALKDATKSLELRPNDKSTLHTLGRIYLEKGLFDQAIAEYHQAGDAKGNLTAFELIDLTWANLEKGELAEARADYEKAMSLKGQLEEDLQDGKEYLDRLEKLSAKLGQTQTAETQPPAPEPSPQPQPQPAATPEPKPESQPQPAAAPEPTPQPQPQPQTQTAAAQAPVVKPPAPEAISEIRTALVIGNAAYKHNPLNNAVNDARAMAQALRAVGFQVTLEENLDQKRMKRAILAFGRQIAEGGVGLFYFAGHGVQSGSSNYLIPVGASIYDELEVEVESVDAAYVLARMASARNRLNIAIFDACRDNPFGRSFRSSARGLAYMNAPSGTFIAYATAPGTVAADGPGQNSFYTRELINQLQVPGLTIEQVFKRVRAAVERRTNGRQIPWESSSLKGEFYFLKSP